MVRKFILITLISCSFSSLFAQVAGIPYQAVLMDRTASQELPGYDSDYQYTLANILVSIEFSLYDMNGLEFSETHHDVLVDPYGMINLVVGHGVYTYNLFENVDWNGKEKWLKVKVDFNNQNNFQDLDYIELFRIPEPDHGLYLSGDSLYIENGDGVDLSTLLAGAGTDDQALTLVGNVIYLEDGGSIDLTDLLDVAGTDDQRLSLTGTILNLEDGGSVDLSGLLSLIVNDDQNITSFNLNGTILEISIEDGNTQNTNLLGLSNDSAFIHNILNNPFFVEAVQANELDGDPTNEYNTDFSVLAEALRITDGGGILSVPLSEIQVDTTSLSNRIDQILMNDMDTDSLNEIQTISLVNDSLFLSKNGGAVDLSPYLNTKVETLTLANFGQDQFATPAVITNPSLVDVYRNGVKIGFSVLNATTIQIEADAVCYDNDEIRIVQSF